MRAPSPGAPSARSPRLPGVPRPAVGRTGLAAGSRPGPGRSAGPGRCPVLPGGVLPGGVLPGGVLPDAVLPDGAVGAGAGAGRSPGTGPPRWLRAAAASAALLADPSAGRAPAAG